MNYNKLIKKYIPFVTNVILLTEKCQEEKRC